jgi:hypothetical protein
MGLAHDGVYSGGCLFRFRIPFVAGRYVHTAFEFSALEGNHGMGHNQSRKIGKDARLEIKKNIVSKPELGNE